MLSRAEKYGHVVISTSQGVPIISPLLEVDGVSAWKILH